MAAKKYYAVKKGKKTGVFKSWAECRAAVEGYPGAEYKGFALIEEANAYLGCAGDVSGGGSGNYSGECSGIKTEGHAGTGRNEDMPGEGCLLAYVDGSYDDSLKKYAFGCVFILP